MNDVRKFRKRPVVIEAVQVTTENITDIATWCGGDPMGVGNSWTHVDIHTLEGVMRANVSDWVIKGVAGEFYPCADRIFKETYEDA